MPPPGGVLLRSKCELVATGGTKKASNALECIFSRACDPLHTNWSGGVLSQHTDAHAAGPARAVDSGDLIKARPVRTPDRRPGVVNRCRLPVNIPVERARAPPGEDKGARRTAIDRASPEFGPLGRKQDLRRAVG